MSNESILEEGCRMRTDWRMAEVYVCGALMRSL